MKNCVIVQRLLGSPGIGFWTGSQEIGFWKGNQWHDEKEIFSFEYPNAILMSEREAVKNANKIWAKGSLEVIKDYGLDTQEIVFKT